MSCVAATISNRYNFKTGSTVESPGPYHVAVPRYKYQESDDILTQMISKTVLIAYLIDSESSYHHDDLFNYWILIMVFDSCWLFD